MYKLRKRQESPPLSGFSSLLEMAGKSRLGFMNSCGQSGLKESKQKQTEAFLSTKKLDILNLQEINIDENSFNCCKYISSAYTVMQNNSPTRYGTACLVKNDFEVTNVQFDSSGPVIVFDVCGLTVVPTLWPGRGGKSKIGGLGVGKPPIF